MDEATQFIYDNPEYFSAELLKKIQTTKSMENCTATQKQIYYIKNNLPKQYKEKITKIEAYQIIRENTIKNALIKCYDVCLKLEEN